MTNNLRETIAKIVCCPDGCILATCGDDACVALNPEYVMLPTADAIITALAAQPQYLSGCLRDGVCRGLCRNTDCPNYDMFVAARVCVEPKEDGVLYPDSAQHTASTKQTISMVPVISNSKWEP